MDTIASQITSLAIVYSIVYSSADQRKHQSSASLAFVWGTRKMFPFDDVIMHGKENIILFLTRCLMSWTHNSTKNNYQLLISPLSLGTVFSDWALWLYHSWSVPSGEHVVLALRRYICPMFLHVQIGAKAIFISHDDVIKWKHFPRYWPFVRGIHRSPVNSPHKGQWRGSLMFSLISTMETLMILDAAALIMMSL